MVFKREIKVCRSGAGGLDPVVVSALRSDPQGSPCVRVPRGAPKPSFIFSFYFLLLCVFLFICSFGFVFLLLSSKNLYIYTSDC